MAGLPLRNSLATLRALKRVSVLPVRNASNTTGRKYNSWKEVPDELIPKTSKRDPDNPIYSHPRYIMYRKKQIFYQQNDGIPIYLKNGLRDYIFYYGLIVFAACMFVYSYSDIIQTQIYPPKKKN